MSQQFLKIIITFLMMTLTKVTFATTYYPPLQSPPQELPPKKDCALCSLATYPPLLNIDNKTRVQSMLEGEPFKSGWYISGGLNFPQFSQGEATTIQTLPYSPPLFPNPPDAFYPSNLKGNISYDVSVGYQIKTHKKLIPAYRLELSYQNTPSITVSGNAEQLSEPPLQTYTGTINNQSFFVGSSVDVGVLSLGSHQALSSYVELGLGFASNSTQNYAISDPLYPLVFPGNTRFDFAWRAGVGLAYHVAMAAHEMVVSLGYRYADKGQAQTGLVYSPGVPSAQSSALQQSVRDNEFLFNVRYVI